MKLALVVSVSVFAALGCAAEPADDEAGGSEDALLAGTETFEHPEVGLLRNGGSYCTATLIRPNVVLTAAHCVTNSPKDEPVTGYAFDIKRSATDTQRFAIDRAYAVPVAADFDGTQAWRAKDIALLRLASAVPAEIAKPLVAATRKPAANSVVVLYGYGCIDRTPGPDGRRPGGGVKRKVTLAWNGAVPTRSVCNGDSGGPWLNAATGAVFGTTSGYVNLDDRYGDIPASALIVNRVADTWSRD